jgi:hypothetical protein
MRGLVAGVLDARVEVVHPACSADGHLAFDVEPVVAEPVVTVMSWSGSYENPAR